MAEFADFRDFINRVYAASEIEPRIAQLNAEVSKLESASVTLKKSNTEAVDRLRASEDQAKKIIADAETSAAKARVFAEEQAKAKIAAAADQARVVLADADNRARAVKADTETALKKLGDLRQDITALQRKKDALESDYNSFKQRVAG